MKNFKYKVLISLFVFIFVAVATVLLTRVTEEEESGSVRMKSATLPLVYMVSEGGHEYNLLHGYVTNIDETMLHECITPLPEDRKLKIRVQNYGQSITGIAYEIRSLDREEFIENTQVTDYTTEKEYTEAVLNIKNLLDEDEEYMLKIIVSTPNNTASYYTRIVLSEDLYLDEKIDYVLYFSGVTYDEEAINEIIPKLEPDSTGDNTNLGHVNIHSKLSQVGWGKLEPEVSSKIWPYIAEIEGNTADIRLDYQVTTKAADNGKDLYDVKEFFRIRRADETTTYVLSYDRWVDQIFDGKDDLNDSGRIYLGINSGLKDIPLISDSTGKVTCFIVRGELWSYNSKTNQFVRIFSFMDDATKYDTIRESHDQHGIKVMSVDGDGNVEFVVYGYMNRGLHEGEMGISVCVYDAKENKVDEILYVPRSEIYDIIKQDVENLVYLNADNRFYMYQNGSIYSIDCTTKEYMVVSDSVLSESCLFAEKILMFAYMENDADYGKEINIIRLETGQTEKIEAGNGRYIKTLGLIDENIIYGMGYSTEIFADENGSMIYPMYRMEIRDSDNGLVKEYEYTNIRIISAVTDASKIIIERMMYDENNKLVPTYNDQLLSKVTASDEELGLKVIATDVRQKETYIMLPVDVPPSDNTKVLRSKAVNFDTGAMIYMSEVTSTEDFYMAYGIGQLKGLYKSPAKAILEADKWAGVVVAPDGAVIWDRYKASSAMVDIEGEYKLVNKFNISGCDLESALYYVDSGKVLRAKVNNESYIIIYGYDKTNAYAVDESTGIMLTYGKAELAAMLNNMGDIVFTYDVERVNTQSVN